MYYAGTACEKCRTETIVVWNNVAERLTKCENNVTVTVLQ